MEIQHLEKVDDFLPGRKYSLIGSQYGDLLNITVNNVVRNYIIETTMENGEPQNLSFKEDQFPMNVVLHDKQEFFILVESQFIIGVFDTEQEANRFLEENSELINQLDRANDGDNVEVCSKDYVEDIALEAFWLQYQEFPGSEKLLMFEERNQFSPTPIEKTANLNDYINQDA